MLMMKQMKNALAALEDTPPGGAMDMGGKARAVDTALAGYLRRQARAHLRS